MGTVEALGIWARATEGEPPAISSQVMPEAHSAHMPTNKALDNWDQLDNRSQNVCLCLILFAGACCCLEEEAV